MPEFDKKGGLIALLRAIEADPEAGWPTYKLLGELAGAAAQEIARCHARLEIDHVFVSGDGPDGLVRQEVPYEERAGAIDGISCRDETIDMLEKARDEDRASLSAASSSFRRWSDQEIAEWLEKTNPYRCGTDPMLMLSPSKDATAKCQTCGNYTGEWGFFAAMLMCRECVERGYRLAPAWIKASPSSEAARVEPDREPEDEAPEGPADPLPAVSHERSSVNYPWLIERTVDGKIQYLSDYSGPTWEPIFTTDPWMAAQYVSEQGALDQITAVGLLQSWTEISKTLRAVNHAFEHPRSGVSATRSKDGQPE